MKSHFILFPIFDKQEEIVAVLEVVFFNSKMTLDNEYFGLLLSKMLAVKINNVLKM